MILSSCIVVLFVLYNYCNLWRLTRSLRFFNASLYFVLVLSDYLLSLYKLFLLSSPCIAIFINVIMLILRVFVIFVVGWWVFLCLFYMGEAGSLTIYFLFRLVLDVKRRLFHKSSAGESSLLSS